MCIKNDKHSPFYSFTFNEKKAKRSNLLNENFVIQVCYSSDNETSTFSSCKHYNNSHLNVNMFCKITITFTMKRKSVRRDTFPPF